jgi:hypothetical protein
MDVAREEVKKGYGKGVDFHDEDSEAGWCTSAESSEYLHECFMMKRSLKLKSGEGGGNAFDESGKQWKAAGCRRWAYLECS